MAAPATVHIVDDEPDVRDALAMLMRSVGLAVTTYPSAQDFLQRYRASGPGCLVLDVRMPGMSGLELQEKLARERIALPIIIITGHGDIAMAVRAMKAGALDFIEKPFDDQALLDRIHEAIERAARTQDIEAERARIAARYAELTRREKEVMALVVTGRLNKLIAAELGLSTRTVEIHRAHIMEKMEAKSLSHLVRMAFALEPQAR